MRKINTDRRMLEELLVHLKASIINNPEGGNMIERVHLLVSLTRALSGVK